MNLSLKVIIKINYTVLLPINAVNEAEVWANAPNFSFIVFLWWRFGLIK